MNMTISTVKQLNLPKIMDDRGNLTFIEGGNHIPFQIKRIYMIYDVPGGEIRGSHAYKELDEVIVALSGSFDLKIEDGVDTLVYTLNRSYNAIYVPHGLWRTLKNFSTNALCLVLASTEFDESDYVRDYNDFRILNNNE